MSAVSMFRAWLVTAFVCTLAARSFGQGPDLYDDPPPAPQDFKLNQDVTLTQALDFPMRADGGVQQPPIRSPATTSNNYSNALPQRPARTSGQTQLWNGSNGYGDWDSGPVFGQPCDNPACDACTLDPAHGFFGCLGRVPGHLAQHGWVRMEYLGWFMNGMHVPPLVTTSPTGTPQAEAGVIGQPGTSVLYGGTGIMTGLRSGGRIRFGTWLNCCETVGIEGEFFSLAQATEKFSASSNGSGNPILARPFFNINPTTGAPANDSELVSYPGVLAGTVSTAATSRLDGAGLRMVFRGCCSQWCQPGDCEVPVLNRSVNTTYFIGSRYLRLAEGLQINENLNSLSTANPGSFVIFDQFNTENTFVGLDMGGTWTFQQNRWSFEVMPRIAFGGTQQEVRIDGSTRTTTGGTTTAAAGGLLTQTSNIGIYNRTIFSFVPEIDLTLGYQIAPRLRLIGGYTLLAWTGVVRPGDQIDTAVNPDLLPPAVPTTGRRNVPSSTTTAPRCSCRASTWGSIGAGNPRFDPLNFPSIKRDLPWNGKESTRLIASPLPRSNRLGGCVSRCSTPAHARRHEHGRRGRHGL